MRLPFFSMRGSAKVDTTNLATKDELANAVAAIIGMAPAELDTLQEIAARIVGNDDEIAAVSAQIAGKQDANAKLTALAGLVLAANKMIYATGENGFATSDITTFARTLLASANASAARAALGAASAIEHIAVIGADKTIASGTTGTLNFNKPVQSDAAYFTANSDGSELELLLSGLYTAEVSGNFASGSKVGMLITRWSGSFYQALGENYFGASNETLNTAANAGPGSYNTEPLLGQAPMMLRVDGTKKLKLVFRARNETNPVFVKGYDAGGFYLPSYVRVRRIGDAPA